jgi:hypothetical protein
MASRDPSSELVRRTRNRYRLMSLFVIYPIYKAVQYLTEGNWVFGALMGVFAAIYLGMVLKLLSTRTL